MDSTDSVLSDFSRWQPFNDQTVGATPSEKGVYVLRGSNGEKVRRLRGESDVLLIGSTKQPIKKRLAEVLRSKEDEGHDYYVKEMAKKYKAQISWRIDEDPKAVETYLLGKYLEDHDELPPLNTQKILSLYRVLLVDSTKTGRKRPSTGDASLNTFLQ
jgi:hypothetical protein